MGKLLFVCGSAEPGKDGVGDYTRILAEELLALGEEISMFALNDRHIQDVQTEEPRIGSSSFQIKRLPEHLGRDAKVSALREELLQFEPDFISVQFVPFSYNRKGIVTELIGIFSRLNPAEYSWGITFHELWVDEATAGSLKKWIWAKAQKYSTIKFIKTLGKPLILTTNQAYIRRLKMPNATVVPLFGNIQISPLAAEQRPGRDPQTLDVLLFGNLTGHLAEFERQIKLVEYIGSRQFEKTRFIFAGRQIDGIARHVKIIQGVLPAAEIEELGPLSEGELSKTIQSVDLAISRADADLFNKSGSTIAILEHGVPVMLRGERKELALTDPSWKDLIYFDGDNIPNQLPKGKKRHVRKFVAEKFLSIIHKQS